MAGLYKISLNDVIEEYGEEITKNLLSEFSCPLSLDIEDFLRVKAIEFEKQSLCRTQLDNIAKQLYARSTIYIVFFYVQNTI
jgi:hypothetical protein